MLVVVERIHSIVVLTKFCSINTSSTIAYLTFKYSLGTSVCPREP